MPVETVPGVRGLLVDLEGTVYEAGRPVAGAAAALAGLEGRGIALCFVTNTTSRPRSKLAAELTAMGIRAEAARIFTAPIAGREYLLSRGLARCHFLVNPPMLEDFEGIEDVDEAPDAVVVGDIGQDFTYARLQRAFHWLQSGAAFVTLARNRYYQGSEGLLLDQGPFVAALEYAAGHRATLVGKPSPDFFRGAASVLGLSPAEIAVVGDDLDSDVAGAQASGMRGILVRTGKFREEDLAASSTRPDAVIPSLADIGSAL